jgi:hypothetical protein
MIQYKNESLDIIFIYDYMPILATLLFTYLYYFQYI